MRDLTCSWDDFEALPMRVLTRWKQHIDERAKKAKGTP